MTIPAFGRCVPVHIYMLRMAGYDLRQLKQTVTSDEQTRLAQMREGHQSLVKMTGHDFGFDLKRWREYLLADGKEHGYKHPYAFSNVDKAIQSVIRDASFQRWADLAAST